MLASPKEAVVRSLQGTRIRDEPCLSSLLYIGLCPSRNCCRSDVHRPSIRPSEQIPNARTGLRAGCDASTPQSSPSPWYSHHFPSFSCRSSCRKVLTLEGPARSPLLALLSVPHRMARAEQRRRKDVAPASQTSTVHTLVDDSELEAMPRRSSGDSRAPPRSASQQPEALDSDSPAPAPAQHKPHSRLDVVDPAQVAEDEAPPDVIWVQWDGPGCAHSLTRSLARRVELAGQGPGPAARPGVLTEPPHLLTGTRPTRSTGANDERCACARIETERRAEGPERRGSVVARAFTEARLTFPNSSSLPPLPSPSSLAAPRLALNIRSG